jgi:hypothetical protein
MLLLLTHYLLIHDKLYLYGIRSGRCAIIYRGRGIQVALQEFPPLTFTTRERSFHLNLVNV